MVLPNNTVVYGKAPANITTKAVTSKLDKQIGFKYPIEADPKKGYFSKLTGLKLIRANISQLLRTEKGERFMLPNYGCDLRKYLMEPMDQTLFNEIRKDILDSIGRYLSRVTVSKIQVFETKTNQLAIKLACQILDEQLISFDAGVQI